MIIKNCPSFDTVDFGYCNTIKVDEQKCKDCANCVMKQIVKRCKDSMDYHSKDMFILGKTNMAGIVLALLQIEEVE